MEKSLFQSRFFSHVVDLSIFALFEGYTLHRDFCFSVTLFSVTFCVVLSMVQLSNNLCFDFFLRYINLYGKCNCIAVAGQL